MSSVDVRKVLIVLSACSFFVGMDMLVVAPLIPTIARLVGFPVQDGGLLISAYALPYGLGAPILGPLAERLGRRKAIFMGVALFAVGTVLTAIGQNFWIMVFFRAITGLSCALVMPNVYAMVGDVVEYSKRGKAMGMVTGAMGASTVLGIPLGTLLAQLGSWQDVFWVVGGGALLILIGIYRLLPRTKVDVVAPSVNIRETYARQMAMVFSNRLVAFSLLSTLLWWVGWQGLFSVMGTFYYEVFHLHTAEVGYMFALAGVGNISGNQVGGRLADGIGKRPVLVAACICSALCVFCIPYVVHSVLLVVILHFVWAHATGWGQSSLGALVSELNPNARATIMGLNSSATYIGMTVASAASVALLSSFGFHMVGQMSAVAFILVAILITSLVMQDTVPITIRS